MKIELTQEQINNISALINRCQISGGEAEVVAELKRLLNTPINIEDKE